LCRAIDAERAAAKIGAVEVELEDLVFRQAHLKPQREECFFDFAFDGALVRQEQVLGELLRDGRAALHHPARPRIGQQRAGRAEQVDTEMFVETPVFRRQHRLDEVVGHFLERHRIVMLDATAADLIAVAVEEGDRELGFLQPALVRCLAEGGDGQRQHEQEPAGAPRRRFRQWLDQEPPPPAGDMKTVHERGEPLVEFARPDAALEHGKVDPRVEIEQKPLEPEPPVTASFGKHVRHASSTPETGAVPVIVALLRLRFSRAGGSGQ
jgi:hypothetical protein